MGKLLLKLKYLKYTLLYSVTFGKLKDRYENKRNDLEIKALPEIVNYEQNRKAGLKVRHMVSTPEIDAVLKYSTLNKIKETALKAKITQGKKVNVCFIVTYISRMSFISIYEAMLKNDLFNPFIVVYDAQENYFEDFEYEWQEHQNAYQHLKDKGYNVFNGYDENKNFIPLEEFKPDIVFTADINLDHLQNHLSNISLNINYLTCYLNYSINTINDYPYHYNNRAIATGWKMFVEARQDYYELVKYSKYCGVNTVLTGYPKLDAFSKDINECKIPDKLNNGNPIVIFAPHHTINHKNEFLNLGTFHLYYKYFLDLVKKYPEINFVFKPHPELRHRLHWLNIMTMEDFDKYTNEWDSQPNGMYVYDGDYIDLFRKSELLIQDSGSFIGEWLPTDKPCIYLVNPKRKQRTYLHSFSHVGRKILDKYYLCKRQEEIEKYFKMIMIDKNDPLKAERIKIKDEIFINIGCAGQKITDYLTEVLTD